MYGSGRLFLNELKDLCPFNPIPNYGMKYTIGIQPGLYRHKIPYSQQFHPLKFIQKQRSLNTGRSASSSHAAGIKGMAALLKKESPDVELGYFNKPVR
jgi:hypothetical protein